MAAQKGRDLLLKIADGAAAESFVTVAGLRATTLSFNAREVDVTSADSDGMWRELLVGAGIKSASVSGSGVFRDAGADARMRDVFCSQALEVWQIIIPDFAVVSGPFKLTSLNYEGPYDGEVKLSLTLVSAGALNITAQ